MSSTYSIVRAPGGALGDGSWENPLWKSANELAIEYFHPKSSTHRPRTLVRLLYDEQHLYARFEVHDQYVISKGTGYQAMVCLDSCAEFFARPIAGRGYFNFEMNCGGSLLLFFIEDSQRTATGFARYTKVDPALARDVVIRHSMPDVVSPERAEPTVWYLSCRIPFSLFEHFLGPLGVRNGSVWRGNFFKCADHSSHPHWASWSSFGEKLNFHQPEKFGEIRFD